MALVHFTEGLTEPPSSVLHAAQLLPNIVDGMARVRPEALYAQIPNSWTSYELGYRKVTYRDLANAINGVAWLLSEKLGKGQDASTLTYLGPNDIGYVVMTLGAAKAGYSLLTPSPMLPKVGSGALLRATKCSTLLTLDPPYAPVVNYLCEESDTEMRIIHVPNIHDLLDSSYPHFPYPHTYEELKDKPLLILHTSGTTGTPKPVWYTHRTAHLYLQQVREQAPVGYYNVLCTVQSNRVFGAFPFSHSAMVILFLFDGIASQTTLISPPSGIPASVATVVEGIERVDTETVCMPTPYVEQIAKDRAWFAMVTGKVRTIMYGGASLSAATGRAFIEAGVRVITMFGSTEMLIMHGIRPLPYDDVDDDADAWQCVQPHPYMNATFVPTGDDLYEMVLVRNAEGERCQPVFTLFPHLSEFHTRDLFVPHPRDPKRWRFKGRADDLIVSATGEMCNPVAFEQELSRSLEVQSALVVGTGRWKKAVLIELANKSVVPGQESAAIDAVWPIIQHANRLLSPTSRVAQSHVLFTRPDKPMGRTGKGTVMRAVTLRSYGQEIDELYSSQEDGVVANQEPYPIHVAAKDALSMDSSGITVL